MVFISLVLFYFFNFTFVIGKKLLGTESRLRRIRSACLRYSSATHRNADSNGNGYLSSSSSSLANENSKNRVVNLTNVNTNEIQIDGNIDGIVEYLDSNKSVVVINSCDKNEEKIENNVAVVAENNEDEKSSKQRVHKHHKRRAKTAKNRLIINKI